MSLKKIEEGHPRAEVARVVAEFVLVIRAKWCLSFLQTSEPTGLHILSIQVFHVKARVQ